MKKSIWIVLSVLIIGCGSDTSGGAGDGVASSVDGDCQTIVPEGAFAFAPPLSPNTTEEASIAVMDGDVVIAAPVGSVIINADRGGVIARLSPEGDELWRLEFRGTPESLSVVDGKIYAYITGVRSGSYAPDSPLTPQLYEGASLRVTLSASGEIEATEEVQSAEARTSETDAYFAAYKLDRTLGIERRAADHSSLWSTRLSREEAGGTVEIDGVIAWTDGGVAVATHFPGRFSSGFEMFGTRNQERPFVLRFDSEGGLLWAKMPHDDPHNYFPKHFQVFDEDFFLLDTEALFRLDGETGEEVWAVELTQWVQSRASLASDANLWVYGRTRVEMPCSTEGVSRVIYDLNNGSLEASPIDMTLPESTLDFDAVTTLGSSHAVIGTYRGAGSVGATALPASEDGAFFIAILPR